MINENKAPRVSVILPVYNTGDFLTPCLDSVLAQSFKDIQVIAVDDGSTDNSLQILKQYALRDRRLRVLENSVNRGVSYSLNRALKHCSAPVVVRMDSDDIMSPGRIARQYEYFKTHPDCILAGGQLSLIDVAGKGKGYSKFPLTNSQIKGQLFYIQTIADSTAAFNRRLIPDMIFYFDETLAAAEGLDLYFRLIPYGCFANLEDTLVSLRNRPGSLSKKVYRNFLIIAGVRWRAVHKYGIKAPPMAGVATILQGLIVFLLPRGFVLWLNGFLKRFFLREKVKHEEKKCG